MFRAVDFRHSDGDCSAAAEQCTRVEALVPREGCTITSQFLAPVSFFVESVLWMERLSPVAGPVINDEKRDDLQSYTIQ